MDSSVTNCEAEFCDSVHSLELHADQDEFHSTVSRLYLNLKDIDNGQTSLNESDVSLIKPETEKNVVINQNVENKDKQDGHLWRNLIIIFVVLNLIWISAIVVLYLEIIPTTDVRTHHVFTEVHDDGDFCVPCDAVYLTEDDVHDNIHRFEKRDDDCCVAKKSTLTNIVTKFADKEYRQQRARDFDSRRPDETHIELNDRSAELRQLDVDQSDGSKLRWKTASSSIGRNITYVQDGGLQVNVTGLYHVYSRLVFVDDGKDTAGRNVSYSIWLRSPGKEDEKLLDISPSFQSASFELEAGDIVEVRMSDVAHLQKLGDKNDNYFGLYYVV